MPVCTLVIHLHIHSVYKLFMILACLLVMLYKVNYKFHLLYAIKQESYLVIVIMKIPLTLCKDHFILVYLPNMLGITFCWNNQSWHNDFINTGQSSFKWHYLIRPITIGSNYPTVGMFSPNIPLQKYTIYKTVIRSLLDKCQILVSVYFSENSYRGSGIQIFNVSEAMFQATEVRIGAFQILIAAANILLKIHFHLDTDIIVVFGIEMKLN